MSLVNNLKQKKNELDFTSQVGDNLENICECMVRQALLCTANVTVNAITF